MTFGNNRELLSSGLQMASETQRPSKSAMKRQAPADIDVLATRTPSSNFFSAKTKRNMSID